VILEARGEVNDGVKRRCQGKGRKRGWAAEIDLMDGRGSPEEAPRLSGIPGKKHDMVPILQESGDQAPSDETCPSSDEKVHAYLSSSLDVIRS
jgi:hypothetical protein